MAEIWDNGGKTTGDQIRVKYHPSGVLTFLHRGQYGEARIQKKVYAGLDVNHSWPSENFRDSMKDGLEEIHQLLPHKHPDMDNKYAMIFHNGRTWSFKPAYSCAPELVRRTETQWGWNGAGMTNYRYWTR